MRALLICGIVLPSYSFRLRPRELFVSNRPMVYDLRTLPFGWKLPPPPICPEVVGRHLQEAFDLMPPPPHLPMSYRPDRDHYLDDLLVVVENDKGWLWS